jgi:hypothetical protein
VGIPWHTRNLQQQPNDIKCLEKKKKKKKFGGVYRGGGAGGFSRDVDIA